MGRPSHATQELNSNNNTNRWDKAAVLSSAASGLDATSITLETSARASLIPQQRILASVCLLLLVERTHFEPIHTLSCFCVFFQQFLPKSG